MVKRKRKTKKTNKQTNNSFEDKPQKLKTEQYEPYKNLDCNPKCLYQVRNVKVVIHSFDVF